MARVVFTIGPYQRSVYPGAAASVVVNPGDTCSLDSLAEIIRTTSWGGGPYAWTINLSKLWLQVTDTGTFNTGQFEVAMLAAC